MKPVSKESDETHFTETCKAMAGLPVSRVWRGHGSAIFLEFGKLTPAKLGSGEAGEPCGEFGVMIEWSWRIEDKTQIVCGSWSEEELWEPAFERLHGADILDVQTFARLTEITMSFSNGLHVVSFATAEGNPQWAIFDRRQQRPVTFHCRNGAICGEDQT